MRLGLNPDLRELRPERPPVRENKRAECAILDIAAWSVEFLRVSYDAAATEAKAAAFGYRITPWTDHLYTLRRKLFGERRGT